MDFNKWNESIRQVEDLSSQETNFCPGDNRYQEISGMCNMAPGYNGNPIVEDIYKTTRKIEVSLYLQEKRAEFKEAERERRKSQVDVVEIDDCGQITARTINTRKTYDKRMLTNFRNPELLLLTDKDGMKVVYLISFTIGNKKKRIFIDGKDAGDGNLLLKKFNAVGADFLIDKKSKKAIAAEQLLALLLKGELDIREIPNKAGWYIDSEGKLVFWEKENITWTKIEKMIL